MKNLFISLFTVGIYSFLFAQEPSSFYFTCPQPQNAIEQDSLPSVFSGRYKSQTDPLKSIVFTTDSIYVELITFGILSKQEVVGNPKLRLEDTLLFGIYPEAPVSVILKNDTLIFGIVSQHLFFKADSSHVIKLSNSEIVLNYQQDKSLWTSSLIKFDAANQLIEIAYIDHELIMDLLKKQKGLSKKVINNLPTFLLSLSLNEFNAFVEAGAFTISERFKKQ